MKEEEFLKALKEEKRKIVFIGDLNYLDLNNGYSFISSYTANSWLIEKKEKGEKIFDASKKGLILYSEDCLEIGLDLISNLYEKGMIGISDFCFICFLEIPLKYLRVLHITWILENQIHNKDTNS